MELQGVTVKQWVYFSPELFFLFLLHFLFLLFLFPILPFLLFFILFLFCVSNVCKYDVCGHV